MEWEQLLLAERFGSGKTRPQATSVRSAFESDVDRIIFSGSFRRLSRKTQVHPFAPNDHVHTRLTHSLEVASVGRTLGRTLGKKKIDILPESISEYDLGSIVQAACMAHDIGNPPFGHAGEAAIAQWFNSSGIELLKGLRDDYKKDITCFEGNAQGFRMLSQTESNLFCGGLRLTYATLGTFLKYPWSSRHIQGCGKFGAFISEESCLESVATKLGMIKKGDNHWCRHPLAYLVEAADDICYATIDLEDAIELGICTFNEVKDILLNTLEPSVRDHINEAMVDEDSYRINIGKLRGAVFEALIEGAIDGYIDQYDSIMSGRYEGNLFSSLAQGDPRRDVITEAKKYAGREIYTDRKKVEVELGCFSTVETLLQAFCTAALDRAQMLKQGDEAVVCWKSELILRLLGNHAPQDGNEPPGEQWSRYQCLRRSVDFVSGMTDNYASYIASQIQGRAVLGLQRP